MSRRTPYNDDIKFAQGNCEFLAYHEEGENGCSYLKLDYEEHPDLEEEDLLPLGKILIKTVEKYVNDNKDSDYELEKHSSSYHVLYKGDCVAKIWHNEMSNSQIENEYGAKKVAEEFVRIMTGKKEFLKMPKLEESKSCGDPMKYKIMDGCTQIAAFKRRSEAKRYIDEFVNIKYRQEIEISGSSCGVDKLENSRKSGNTIELFHGYSIYTADRRPRDLLYHLREYIHDSIEEA